MPQSHQRVAIVLAFLAVWLCAGVSCAQESRVNELIAQVKQLYQEGKYAEAVPAAAETVKLAEKAFGPDDARIAVYLNNLALLYENMGSYADAEPLYLRAIAIDEKTLGPDHPDLATVLCDLAVVYMDQGRNAEAEPLYQRALRIDEKALGAESPGVATDLNNLALLYDNEGRYPEAEPLFLRALRIDEKALGPDQIGVAPEVGNLAAHYLYEGRYAEAEPLFQRALHIREKALGPDHPDVATDLNQLAMLYHHQGNYAQAEPLYQRAVGIYEKALGPDHPMLATELNNLGMLFEEQAKYAEAEPLYQRALSIREKALGPDHADVASSLSNLASLYEDEGKYTEAEPLCERALLIYEKALGPDHTLVATGLNNLAALYVDQKRYAEAKPLYERALSINEKALGPKHPQVAVELNNLGAFDRDQGSYAEAEPLFQRALHIREEAFGPEHRDVAASLDNLGVLYYAQGRYADAEPLFQRALRIQEKALGPDHPDVDSDLLNLGLLYGDQGKYGEAEPFFHRDLENIFQQFQSNFAFMSEKERLDFLDKVSNRFPLYFSFVHRFREKDPKLAGSMYNLLLWEKGFVAGSIADLRRTVESSGDPGATRLLGELTAKRTQIAGLLNVTPADRDAWLEQINQLKTEANDIEKALIARSSAFAEKKNLEQVTWQQVRDALKPDEAAVEFARFNYYEKKWTGTSYYVALVVTRESKDQPAYVVLGDGKQIEGDALVRFQQSVRARGVSLEPEAATLPGADAYDLIWKPLEKALAGKTRIYLSPDGVLNQIPLGIIPAGGGKLLMERYDLRLLSSTKDILRTTPPRAAAAALLVGDPDFDMSEDQQLAAVRKLDLPQQESDVMTAALRLEDRSRDLGNGTTLPRLPGTGAEVNAIAQLMKEHNWKTSLYTGDLALKQVVEGAGSPRVLHLATHGFFLPDQPIKTDPLGNDAGQPSGLEDPMLRSGLYFAGADRALAGKPTAEGLDNGVLTAMEAGSLNLRGTELVVLSACNTGQGDLRTGEGVFGLRRALEEAGAQSVLMSMWSVPDRETLKLMQLFYKKWLSGMEIHEALKQAQLEMRELTRRNNGGKDLPYYWGAFVLVGR